MHACGQTERIRVEHRIKRIKHLIRHRIFWRAGLACLLHVRWWYHGVRVGSLIGRLRVWSWACRVVARVLVVRHI